MASRLLDLDFINSIRGKKFHLIESQAEGFYPHRDSSKNPVSNYYRHIFGSGGQRPEDEFVVMKGVKFRKNSHKDSSWLKIEELVQKNLIVISEEKFELVENCGFSSPSQALSIMSCNNLSAFIVWRDEHNKTIKKLEDEYNHRNITPQEPGQEEPIQRFHQRVNQEINVKSELLSAFENRISTISTEEKEDIVKRRIGQDILREHLIGTQKKCLLTGIRNKDLLRVSHIKPWAQCESTSTRLDPDNCLLLSALWDAAFDRGLITFSQEGTLKFSQDITEELDKLGSCNEHISFDNIIDMDNHLEHLRWHRENIFRGDAP